MKIQIRLLQTALLVGILSAMMGCGGTNSFNFIPRDNASVNLTVNDNGEEKEIKGSVTGDTSINDGRTLTATVSTTTSDAVHHTIVLRVENFEGEIAAGQNYTLTTSGPNSIVYTQTASGEGDKVWSAKSGSIHIDKIEGNQITMTLRDVTAEATTGGEPTDQVIINGTVTLTYVSV